jgi:glyoxylase-like metal-dependent hydrolase (beta-lactamase superfamily II)
MATSGIRYPFPKPPAEGEAITVAPGVLWMRLPLPMALDHVNVYAVDEGDSWTVIDTGFDTKKTRAVWETLLAGPLAGKPVSRVIATHYHPDHVGLVGWFMDRGATFSTPRTAWLMTRMLTLEPHAVPTAETLAFYVRSGMDADEYTARRTERPFNFADCVAPIPLGYTRLQEGQMIQIGSRTWDIKMGDGHAPEHATFWSRDDNLVIGGDQLLSSISANLGVYAAEPEADPVAEWLTSCEKFKPFADDEQLVLGGHKLPFTGLPLRLTQMVENHHGALDRLMKHLSEPRTAGQCFSALFKRKIGRGEYGLALVEAVAHVNHLYLAGKASRTLGADGAYYYAALDAATAGTTNS